MRHHKKDLQLVKPAVSLHSLYHHVFSTPEYDMPITTEPDINIEFDYPIKSPVQFPFHHDGGFTLKDILMAVRDGYNRIYEDAEKYGVWGYEVDDLFLESVETATSTLIILTVSGS
jgi:hypothetical protein